jgi:hypothetical protein
MNRKQFLILVVVLIVLGGAGAALFRQDIADYRASGAKIGGKLLPDLKAADIAVLHLKDSKHETTLKRGEKTWTVEERGGYPANVQAIREFIVKLLELNVTQSEAVGESLWPRVNLALPGKGEGGGTLVQFKDKSGKVLAGLVLGKQVLKKDPVNPLPGAQNGVPAGRYVRRTDAKTNVIVVSDPLSSATAAPGHWLNKMFFKPEHIKTLTVDPAGSAGGWTITREEEWGQWKFAHGKDKLNASAAVSAVNALGDISFADVAMKAEDTAKATTVVAQTFDNLKYTVKIAKAGENYRLEFDVSGSPPKTRKPEKGEKPEEKASRDKDFAEARQHLVSRMELEQAISRGTFVVEPKEVEPLLKTRAQMVQPAH